MPDIEYDLEFEVDGNATNIPVRVEFSAFCNECGAHICGNVTQGQDYHGKPAIEIAPCEKCLEESHEKGRGLGVLEGMDTGLRGADGT